MIMRWPCYFAKEAEQKATLQQAIVNDIEQAGYHVLWQRDVPYAFSNCGPGAKK